MIADIPFRRPALHDEPLEVPAPLVAIGQRAIIEEAEATVVRGIAEHDAAIGPERSKPDESLTNQRAADSDPLQVRYDRDRAEAVPASGDAIDPHRREGDVADDGSVVRGRHQRDGRLRSG